MVSVVIPSHRGAEKQTRNCIFSVKTSSYQDIEIIVVNEGLERSAQRNIGIKKAKGEYLLFLDSDQEVHPFLIADCVELMNTYDALYIPEHIATPGWFGRLRNWERQFYTATAVDVVRFVRASHCPLFDETMSGPEDSDWDRRVLGRRGVSRAYINHYDNVGIIQYFKKKTYYAKSMRRFAEKWPNDKVLNLRYRCLIIFIEKGKWRDILRSPVSALLLILILFLGRGIIYLYVIKKYY